MREPLRWALDLGRRVDPSLLENHLRRAALGPADGTWQPPAWLKRHQVDAARRVCGCLETLSGALLADAVGLGKTYVALAVATRYRRTCAIVPAALVTQWKRVSEKLGVEVAVVTHEGLSRGARLPRADLTVVDEAHRFRNPDTQRYHLLARSLKRSRLLLFTATPVVNRGADLVHLLRLFAADNALAVLGVPSLEGALETNAFAPLVHAAAAAVVARSPQSIDGLADLLPRISDGTVIRPAPAQREALLPLLRAIDELRFPSAVDSHEAALLRLHLLYRLASSTTACRETARRHLVYTERAIAAARRGGGLSRASARRIFRFDEELLLDLDCGANAGAEAAIDPAPFELERDRLNRLVATLSHANGSSPKQMALANVLSRRAGNKTIVFTTAVATALDLARSLRWHKVAVVGGGRAWIASGRVPVEEALALFAPIAREQRQPHKSLDISTLIATDLASEGLDLQDADAVVHYDLPWTPLKLGQRVGRIARLGSEHDVANVYWFAPPAPVERRLRMEARLAQKVGDQLRLGVPATSTVGRGRVVNELLDLRERFGRAGGSTGCCAPGYAVVSGPLCGIISLEWAVGDTRLPELIALCGAPLRQQHDYAVTDRVLNRLLAAQASPSAPPDALIDSLLRLLRTRLASADMGSTNLAAGRLRRRILTQAYNAGHRRDSAALVALDSALDRLNNGATAGQERFLEEILDGRIRYGDVAAWLRDLPSARSGRVSFRVTAALFGDGSAVQGEVDGPS